MSTAKSAATILIVDDHQVNLKLARVLFESEGYTVLTAEDADQALQVLAHHRPALVLMDIQLPGMDGLQLTRHLKADPETADIVIIAMTAYAMKGDEALVRAAGCDGYITKPIDTRVILPMIAAHLPAR